MLHCCSRFFAGKRPQLGASSAQLRLFFCRVGVFDAPFCTRAREGGGSRTDLFFKRWPGRPVPQALNNNNNDRVWRWGRGGRDRKGAQWLDFANTVCTGGRRTRAGGAGRREGEGRSGMDRGYYYCSFSPPSPTHSLLLFVFLAHPPPTKVVEERNTKSSIMSRSFFRGVIFFVSFLPTLPHGVIVVV